MMQKILLIILISVFSFSLHAQQQTSTDLIRRGIELHDEEKFQEAIDVYKQINENDSLYDYMLYEISYSFMQLEEYDSAIYYVNIGLELESSNQKLLLQQLATAYDNSGDPEKAIEIYTKALEKYPFDYLLYYNLGVTYSNQNEFEKSVECFQNAIINNPFHSTSHLSLGKLMARQGLLTKAIISLEIFLELEPESERSNIVLVYLNELADNHIDTAWGEPIVPFTDNEIFSEVDHFIKSGIALKDNFKTGIKFKYV